MKPERCILGHFLFKDERSCKICKGESGVAMFRKYPPRQINAEISWSLPELRQKLRERNETKCFSLKHVLEKP